MTVIWLIVWLIENTPHVGHWNSWMIALVVCGAIDFFGGGGSVRA